MGMANALGAIADGGDALYYNPAGMANTRRVRVDFQPVGLKFTNDLYNEASDLDQLLDDIESLQDSESPLEDPGLEDVRRRLVDRIGRIVRENLGLDTVSPIRIIVPLGVGNYSIAVGGMAHAWSQTELQVRKIGLSWSDFEKDVLNDGLFYNTVGEASYGGGAALEFPVMQLPLEISLGFAARRIHRWQMDDEDDLLGLDDVINPYGKDGIQGTEDDFEKRFFDPEHILDSLHETSGYNMDAGVILSIRDSIYLGAASRNVIGKIGDEKLPSRSEVSAAVNLAKISTPGISLLDVILAGSMDVCNEVPEDKGIVEKGRFGLEVSLKLPTLEISGRMGSNHGFLTLGAGIQFLFLDLDYAFYGDRDTDWHALSLNLAF